MYSTSSSSESPDTVSFATIELESRDEVNPVAKEESRGDEEGVFEAFETIRAESSSAELIDPPPGSSSSAPPPGSSNS
jgi:hypothetical protein